MEISMSDRMRKTTKEKSNDFCSCPYSLLLFRLSFFLFLSLSLSLSLSYFLLFCRLVGPFLPVLFLSLSSHHLLLHELQTKLRRKESLIEFFFEIILNARHRWKIDLYLICFFMRTFRWRVQFVINILFVTKEMISRDADQRFSYNWHFHQRQWRRSRIDSVFQFVRFFSPSRIITWHNKRHHEIRTERKTIVIRSEVWQTCQKSGCCHVDPFKLMPLVKRRYLKNLFWFV